MAHPKIALFSIIFLLAAELPLLCVYAYHLHLGYHYRNDRLENFITSDDEGIEHLEQGTSFAIYPIGATLLAVNTFLMCFVISTLNNYLWLYFNRYDRRDQNQIFSNSYNACVRYQTATFLIFDFLLKACLVSLYYGYLYQYPIHYTDLHIINIVMTIIFSLKGLYFLMAFIVTVIYIPNLSLQKRRRLERVAQEAQEREDRDKDKAAIEKRNDTELKEVKVKVNKHNDDHHHHHHNQY